jgi:transcriptional regulator GlxA family with amidase domain
LVIRVILVAHHPPLRLCAELEPALRSHLEPSFVSLIFFCFSKEIMMPVPRGRMADAVVLRKLERRFSELTGKQLQRAVHRSTTPMG